MSDTVTINFSIKRKLLLLFLNLGFILLGLFLLIKANELKPFSMVSSVWIVRIAGATGILYFGILLISYFKIIFRKDALVIDKDGIVENSSFNGVGRIYWSQISEIKRLDAGPVHYILIFVKEPDALIRENGNWFERWHLRNNLKRYRTPIVISMIWLHIYIDELESLLRNYLKEYRNNTTKN